MDKQLIIRGVKRTSLKNFLLSFSPERAFKLGRAPSVVFTTPIDFKQLEPGDADCSRYQADGQVYRVQHSEIKEIAQEGHVKHQPEEDKRAANHPP